jgi:2'-5' RNA ligase
VHQAGARTRLFFALWPPPAVATALHAWALAVRRAAGGRPIDGAAIHLTLAFLGEIAAARLDAALAAARRVRGAAHALPLEAARQWPERGIVWVGPRAAPAPLEALADSLAAELAREGFELEKRRFLAHVTLLRHARARCRLPELPLLAWPVREFVLARSMLGAEGARYATVARFPLVAGGPALTPLPA